MYTYEVIYQTTDEKDRPIKKSFIFTAKDPLDYFLNLTYACQRHLIGCTQDIVSIEEIKKKGEKLDRNGILDQAKSLINGERETTYGDPLVAHGQIAKGWSAILGIKDIPPSTVALMMAWLKLSRILSNKKYEDSYVDLIGYVALSAECAEKEDGREEKSE